jgi:hypothetical protein
VALGTGLVAELNDRDLDRSWAAAGGLSAQEAQAINQSAGLHLMGLLGEDLDPSDHAAAAIDAALVFLLAMKRYGVSDPRQIPACAVRWTPTGSLPRIHLAS